MTDQVYSHFSQVKAAIYGVEAIDYFFAKEMINALMPDKVNNSNLFHVFLALHVSLRAGHSCLPLHEIAEQHWGKGFVMHAEQTLAQQPDETNLQSSSQHNLQNDLQHKSQNLLTQLSHVGFVFPSLAELQTMISELSLLESDNQLLVFQNNNVYLRRYFQFENDLVSAINTRLAQQSLYDNHHIRNCITTLFPDDSIEEVDWQKVAVANAINKNFSVIAGGPGTGKTYTVTKLLAALLMLHKLGLHTAELQETGSHEGSPQEGHGSIRPVLNIALVAPTGKAAQRLSESIINAVQGFKGLIEDDVLALIPSQAQTIHRLLGVIPNSPNFRHQEDNRLNYDIVLIDEVSMVDLPLMTRIFRALKSNAKVILLGDADQLPSVAAGSVLADIAPRPHGGFSQDNQEYLTKVCQLTPAQASASFSPNEHSRRHCNNRVDYLTFLVKSRRFDGQGGIGLLASSVISGDTAKSWKLLNQSLSKSDKEDKSAQLSMALGDLDCWLAPLVKQYYQPIESCTSVIDAFVLLAKFRVLCATRQGDYGVERMNEVIKGYLGKNNRPYQQNQQVLYHGQPIMINENDYRLGLYNGDVGIMWRVVDQEGKQHLMACFEDTMLEQSHIDLTIMDASIDHKNISDEAKHHHETEANLFNGIRKILPSRLPKFESVYAMTIHKTQGSEFSHVAMVLSATESDLYSKQQKGSKLLSRELLYTGITRAKAQLTVASNQRIWQQAVTAKIKRHSGLHLCSKP
jgi:exodeoxyribonuclease V alpha subunit